MLRQIALLMICSLLTSLASLASGSTTTYRGVLTSRQYCSDDGDAFSIAECQAAPLGQDRSCVVTLTSGASVRRLTQIQVTVPFLETIGERRANTMIARLKAPLLLDSSGVFSYSTRVDQTAKIEIKVRSTGMLLQQVKFEVQSEKSRGREKVQMQYTCEELKAVSPQDDLVI